MRNSIKKPKQKSSNDIIKKIRKHATKNARNLEDVDIVKTLRKMRNQGKW